MLAALGGDSNALVDEFTES
uniref:Uncharacterized protein n=1 Tax=Arundo donax TaxID=35708 RepID=A0A0A9HBI9_ARUDO